VSLLVVLYDGAEGIAPSYCINPIMSASTKSSAALPSTTFEMPVELKETYLLVGGMP
jgi:hypothetical protein